MPGREQCPNTGTLLTVLRDRIARDGPLTVDAYMRACATDAVHGYWSRPATIGARGDFVTAPEISQVFGELVGLWCAITWQGMGSPSPVRLVELGPGRGTLMRDALRAARAMPAFLDAAAIHLVETSPTLRAIQRQTLKHVSIAWHAAIEQVPTNAAIVVANEFLDALPIRQLVLVDGQWRERVVEADADGRLRFGIGPKAPVHVAMSGASLEPGTIVEARAGEEALLADLAKRGDPLAVLFIDYGPAAEATGDTLQAMRAHAWADPLDAPGTADLTAHVHFAGLARKAHAAGFAVDGPLTQAEFLGRLGIAERASRLMAANPQLAPDIEASVQRLVSPTGMGTLFKVMAVRSPSLPPLVPFG
jgi:NADH dehydrogenase [ubiquinone] 1 alpha subcomplex assembly factor 7